MTVFHEKSTKQVFNRIFSLLLAAAMVFGLLPACNIGLNTQAEAAGSVSVYAEVSGAEIYVNGAFGGAVTAAVGSAASVSANPGDTVSLVMPGYTCEPQEITEVGETLYFAPAPELYPPEYAAEDSHITLRVTASADGETETEFYSLSDALEYAATVRDTVWCVIELVQQDDSYTELNMTTVTDDAAFRLRNHYTIIGVNEDGEPARVCANMNINPWGVDGLRLFNLDLYTPYGGKFVIRADDGDENGNRRATAVYTKNIYVCNCALNNLRNDYQEVTLAQCVRYGRGGTAYGSGGTFNLSNINFCNNNITGQLFNFAAAGDGDYNVVDGYTVMGNRFEKGGPYFLTADAHSWYVYAGEAAYSGSYDSTGNQDPNLGPLEIGVCEYNIIRNILVSGNKIHNGTISLQAANLGNKNNLLEKAVVRCNRMTNDSVATEGGTGWAEISLAIVSTVCADGYEEDGRYSVPAGLTNTEGNTTRDVEIYSNYIECGQRGSHVMGTDTALGEQKADNNTTYNINLHDNTIISAQGFQIVNYGRCLGEPGDVLSCTGNTLHDVVFENNTLTTPMASGCSGLTVAGAGIATHGIQYDDYHNISGTMKDITVKGNTVKGYQYGIMVAGSIGEFEKNISLSGVEVLNNTVANSNRFSYPLTDVGIVLAGSAGQTHAGEEFTANLANTGCSLSDVTVRGNQITARVGIAAAGLVMTYAQYKTSDRNTLTGAVIENNTIFRRAAEPEKPGDDRSDSAGILAGDIIELHDYAKRDLSAYTGSKATGVTIQNNTVSDEFPLAVVNAADSVTLDSLWSFTTGNAWASRSINTCTVYQENPTNGGEHIHTYTENRTPATCTATGSCTYTCSVCGNTYTEELPLAAHDYKTTAEAPAGCTTAGSRTYTCTVCSDSCNEDIPALGHSYKKTAETPADCTTAGSRTYTCGVCNDSYSEPIPALGHSYEKTAETPADCTETGSRTYTCGVCDDSYSEDIPALGHSYEKTAEAPAACTEAGSRTYTCTGCDDSYSEDIPALGHELVCGSCTRCDYTENRIAITVPETLVSKKSVSLKAELLPEKLPGTSFVWSITDGAEYATLSSSGKLTAKAVTEQHTVTIRVVLKGAETEPAEAVITLVPKVTAVRILQGEEPVTGRTLSYNLRDETSEPIVLTADTLPADATQQVSWKCSDTKSKYCRWELAEDGTLTVIPAGTGKVGTVTFTAKAADGSGKSAKVKIYFSNIALEGDLSISNLTNSVTSGKKLKLTYAFTPIKPTANKLVWSINPEGAAYASVSSSGIVSAKKGIGTAEDGSCHTIIVTAALKSNPEVKASIELEILPLTTAVAIFEGTGETATTVSGTVITVSGTEPLQFTAAAIPDKALQSFTWKTSNKKLATVSPDGIVTFTGKTGTVTITATAADGSGKKATVKLVITG